MSPALDLVIRGATVVLPSGCERLDVGVESGRIAMIDAEIGERAAEERDATGLHLMPGAVDPHVHLNEPGRAEWEGWATGTRALAAGGVTTTVEMPLNAHPPTVTADAFDEKLEVAGRSAVVDFGLWGGLVPGGVEHLAELWERGVVGFKAFMCESGIDDFPRADDATLYAGMREAARLGAPVAVHAENEEITAGLAAGARAAGRTAVRDYLASRPVVAETEAIARALLLAEETGCALHVVHVSTGRGIALVAEARARGVDASCETCPHYLVLDEDDVERIGAAAKCAPPLRPPNEREALWGRIEDGTVDLVASDHSPSPPELKQADSFFDVWGGIAGGQSTLPLMLDEGHHARGLPLERIAELLSGAPARRFRLAGKGALEPGADADLALVDIGAEGELGAGDLLSRHRLSPYIGRAIRGRVVETRVRGALIQRDGRVTGEPAGRLVRPAPVQIETSEVVL
jgi:allantoinase